jgi:hypothetical protein
MDDVGVPEINENTKFAHGTLDKSVKSQKNYTFCEQVCVLALKINPPSVLNVDLLE